MNPHRPGGLDGDRQFDLLLRPDQDLTSMLALCRLAGRLGVRAVWAHHRQIRDDGLLALRSAAAPALLGIILDEEADWPTDTAVFQAGGVADDVLFEFGTRTETFVNLCGGYAPYGERAHTARLDPRAAGYVVRGVERDEAARRCRTARASIDDLVARTRIMVDVPVVFGRTLGEAEARLLRDGWLRRSTDPRRDGLFGTFSDAQQQAANLFEAGAHVLRATLATEADEADLLAQLRAVVASPLRSLLPQALLPQNH